MNPIDVLVDLAGRRGTLLAGWLSPAAIILLGPEPLRIPALGAMMVLCLVMQQAERVKIAQQRRELLEGR